MNTKLIKNPTLRNLVLEFSHKNLMLVETGLRFISCLSPEKFVLITSQGNQREKQLTAYSNECLASICEYSVGKWKA